jgi:hypothetical protein
MQNQHASPLQPKENQVEKSKRPATASHSVKPTMVGGSDSQARNQPEHTSLRLRLYLTQAAGSLHAREGDAQICSLTSAVVTVSTPYWQPTGGAHDKESALTLVRGLNRYSEGYRFDLISQPPTCQYHGTCTSEKNWDLLFSRMMHTNFLG